MLDAQGSIYGEPVPKAAVFPIGSGSTRFALRGRLGWLVVAGTAMVLASAAIYPSIPHSYQATSLVLLQPTDRDGQPEADASSRNALDENAIQTYRDILASRPLLQPLVQRYRDDPEFNPAMRRTPGRLAQAGAWLSAVVRQTTAPAPNSDLIVENNLRKHMVIQRDRKSYALGIGFASANPDKAAAMANGLASAFVANQIERKQRLQTELATRLGEQVLQLQQRARDSEAAVNGYRVKSGLIHRGERVAAERQLEALSGQLAKATADAEYAEDRARSLLEMQQVGSLDAAPEVMASPVIQGVKQRLMALNSTAGSSGAGLTVMNDLKTAIGGEARRIVRAAQADAAIARHHVDALQADLARLDGRLVYWQEADRQLRELERIADADDAALKQAMGQLRAQIGRIAMLRADAEIIATAVAPTRPAFPNLPLYMLGTAMMVMLLSGLILSLPGKQQAARGGRVLVQE